MSDEKRIELAVKWLSTLNESQKTDLADVLLRQLIISDYIHVHDEETAAELASESGKPIAEYLAPYWGSCGEPIIETGE
mgnify:CR=1 FL=1